MRAAENGTPMEPHRNGDSGELLREVLEARNQMIKTANAVTGLSTEVRELKHAQQRRGRGRTMSSLATYAVFLALVAASFFFTYRARIDRAELEQDQLRRQNKALLTRLREREQEIADRARAATQAYEFYGLLRQRKISEALARYDKVAGLPLTKVEAAMFRDEVSRHRSRLAYRAYNAGVRAVTEKDWGRAAEELRRSLSLIPEPPHEASLYHHLGLALTRLGNYTEAAAAMERALAADAERLVSREVRYQLGTVYEQLGQRVNARRAYEQYLRKNANAPLARSARARIKALAD